MATGELRKVVGPYSGNEDVPEDSARLEAGSLVPESPVRMKSSRSLAGVMDKLGEALQVIYLLDLLCSVLFACMCDESRLICTHVAHLVHCGAI